MSSRAVGAYTRAARRALGDGPIQAAGVSGNPYTPRPGTRHAAPPCPDL